jgi:hypothetical protein
VVEQDPEGYFFRPESAICLLIAFQPEKGWPMAFTDFTH